MLKIKDIHDRLLKDPAEYSGFAFLVAERVFLIVATAYFFSLLGTIGGFYLSWISTATISMLTYHLYSLLIISTVWFGFAWSEYLVYIYAPTRRYLSFAALGFLVIIGIAGLYAHISPIFL